MARAFAQPLGIPAYIYDAVTSDELVAGGPGHRLQGGHPHQLLPCAQRPGHLPQVRGDHWAGGMRT